MKIFRPHQIVHFARSRHGFSLALAGLAFVSVLGLTAATFSASRQQKAASAGESAVRDAANNRVLTVNTRFARLESGYRSKHSFIGRVEAARAADLGFELGGLVIRLLADEGELVKQGQVIAVLDTARLKSRRSELAAALNEAEARLSLARVTAKRMEKAAATHAVSDQELDAAQHEVSAHQSAVNRFEAQIESVEVDIAKSSLVVPFDGVIVARRLDEGKVVAGGEPVFHLLDSAPREVRVGVSAATARTIEAGSEIEVLSGDRSYAANVKAILPTRKKSTRTVDVILSLEESHRDLFDGDLAEVIFSEEHEEPGFWLARSALTEGVRGLWSVYVAESLGDGRQRPGEKASHVLQRREIDLLHQEEDDVYVRGTLREGERVVAGGMHRLVPGQKVAVRASVDLSPAMHVGMVGRFEVR